MTTVTMLSNGSSPSPAIVQLANGFSLEITVRDVEGLKNVTGRIPPGTRISITFLPGETFEARLAAATTVRQLGFVPVPHLSARRFNSIGELQGYLDALRSQAEVEDVFVIAGDTPRAVGPFADALSLIESGVLSRAGIRHVGIAGYPEGHAHISVGALNQALRDKHEEIVNQGLTCSIVTQFGFDAAPVLAWLSQVRANDIRSLVRVGLPGPAKVKTLLRFAARCGVVSSANVMRKYGISISKLLTTAGPDLFSRDLKAGLDPDLHGAVALHFYPFGGLSHTLEWVHRSAASGM